MWYKRRDIFIGSDRNRFYFYRGSRLIYKFPITDDLIFYTDEYVIHGNILYPTVFTFDSGKYKIGLYGDIAGVFNDKYIERDGGCLKYYGKELKLKDISMYISYSIISHVVDRYYFNISGSDYIMIDILGMFIVFTRKGKIEFFKEINDYLSITLRKYASTSDTVFKFL
jgi:hypothetical protein